MTSQIPAPGTAARRTDLDALRGFAMALGIVLHASLSFFESGWPIQDPAQEGWFALCMAVIHSFRMPLFFILSGFFTAFMLRRSGLAATVRQRLLRLFLPLLLAVLTIAPLSHLLSSWGTELTRRPHSAADPLVAAILRNDADAVRQGLARVGQDWIDPVRSSPALHWAALAGHPGMIDLVLQEGGLIGGRGPDGYTALHLAALYGRDRAVAHLLQRGADPAARDGSGMTPFQRSLVWATAARLTLPSLGLPDVPAAAAAEARARCSELLLAAGPRPPETIALLLTQFLLSNTFRFSVGPVEVHLFDSNVFYHLWFLWLLGLIVLGFAVAVKLGCAPSGRHLWAYPVVSLVPLWFTNSAVGADLWMGPLPAPHNLALYACFFWFGAAVFAREGMQTSLGSRWPWQLGLGLLVLLPGSLFLWGNKFAALPFQLGAIWLLPLGVIGIFRRYASNLGPRVRWISDTSYWMYLAHLPLVLLAQLAAAFLPGPAAVKFLLINGVVLAVLLASYEGFVRYTWLGTLLNGPRARAGAPGAT